MLDLVCDDEKDEEDGDAPVVFIVAPARRGWPRPLSTNSLIDLCHTSLAPYILAVDLAKLASARRFDEADFFMV